PSSAALDLHLERVATAIVRFRRLVSQDVILRLLLADLFQSAHQVVGVEDDEPAGAVGELIQHLLVGGCAGRELRNDLPRLAKRAVVGKAIPESGNATIAAGCTTGPCASGSASAAGSAAGAPAAGSDSTSTAAAGSTAEATTAARSAAGPPAAPPAAARTASSSPALSNRDQTRTVIAAFIVGIVAKICCDNSGFCLNARRIQPRADFDSAGDQSAHIHGIDRNIGSIAGANCRSDVRFDIQSQRKPGGQEDQRLA